jgi:hypothetical protein
MGTFLLLAAEPSHRVWPAQEFDVLPSRTVREEFMSAFGDQMTVRGGASTAASKEFEV